LYITKILKIIFVFICGAGVETNLILMRSFIGLLHQPWMTDSDDGRTITGMNYWEGNRSTGRKSAPVPFCQPLIPHELTQARTLTPTIGSRPLAAWAKPWYYETS
jgi:hypothetical protein